MHYINFSELNHEQKKAFESWTTDSYPGFLNHSAIIKKYWKKLGEYFPEYQIFGIDEHNKLIGFINSIPISLERSLQNLPDEGWDWLISKGVSDYDKGKKPNCLGGLQVNVKNSERKKGFSKLLISRGKQLKEKMEFKNFIIPIRPILKSNFPNMEMKDYLLLKSENKIYDPWIRTHVNNGADIIKVCKNSMNINRNIKFWQNYTESKLVVSGKHLIDGCLNPIIVDSERKVGEYKEENIWINYS